jgi:hypothetical protein
MIEHADPIQGLPESVRASVRFAKFLLGLKGACVYEMRAWRRADILEESRKKEANDRRLRCGDTTMRGSQQHRQIQEKRRAIQCEATEASKRLGQ